MKKHYYIEFLSIILAFITVIINILDLLGKINLNTNLNLYYLDTMIMIYFIFEYIIRLYFSENKKNFVLNNKLDLIAIIPFNSLFKMFRIFKIVRILKLIKLFRVLVFVKRFNNKSSRFLKTNGFIYIFYSSIIIVFLGAIAIFIVEKDTTVHNFGDALWWSFVTATTVGYGDLSPSTTIGRIIASILMITGIGTIGMLTGAISTFFIKNENEKYQEDISDLIDYIRNTNELNEIDKNSVIDYILFLKNKYK